MTKLRHAKAKLLVRGARLASGGARARAGGPFQLTVERGLHTKARRGGLAGSPAPPAPGAPGAPGFPTHGRARPLAPEGTLSTPSLHPGAGWRGLLGLGPRARAIGAAGGTWGLSCKASSSSSLSTAGMAPRGGAEGRMEGRRAGGAAAEAAPGSGDAADALCPRRPRARPRLA